MGASAEVVLGKEGWLELLIPHRLKQDDRLEVRTLALVPGVVVGAPGANDAGTWA